MTDYWLGFLNGVGWTYAINLAIGIPLGAYILLRREGRA